MSFAIIPRAISMILDPERERDDVDDTFKHINKTRSDPTAGMNLLTVQIAKDDARLL